MGRARDPSPLGNRLGASTQVGAAAAVVGGAAIAGKLARDRRADSVRKAQQAFCLHLDESIPNGIRRIARGQLDQAHATLADSPKRELASAVHEVRKSFKRLRATVRLARGGIGDATYRHENTAFRDSGRRLSGVRDASVLIETLHELEKDSGEDLPPEPTLKLQERLDHEREQALASLRTDEAMVAAFVADIKHARARTASWTFDTEGFDALEPGLRRIYRRGRKAMRRAHSDPTDENLHEWRKRVKDLWHVEQIMRSAAPKKIKKLRKRTHALSDLLGDDHDLAELRLAVDRTPDSFADQVAQAAQIAVIDRRRKGLQKQAFATGKKVYRRSPKQFVRAIRRGWQSRVRPPATAA
jgi:CHAD domain-containing protein